MAERQNHLQPEYMFKHVQLLKKNTLGTGSYGAVCKAKCDQLVCAAKMLYPVLFQMNTSDPGKEHRQPFRRFKIECQFLSRINHPNIVQYLGTYHDPETNAPVLLMELMDQSLTHFLESSPGDLPYHTQVNLSEDIAQALAFLHSNGVIHRDLSSNNVLLLASTRAKVTDFGMSKLADLNATRLATMTTCPGTPAFMSPEALNEPPVYTEKLDNFSFGVLLVQITTRQFPKPTDRFKMRQLVDPQFPNQAIQANVPVPELERRQAHIDLIPPAHPLLLTALHCLRDSDGERPTATQLCQTMTGLKRTTRYQESFPQNVHLLQKLLVNQETIIAQKDCKLQANQEQLQAIENTTVKKNMLLLESQATIAKNKEQLLVKDKEIDLFILRLNKAAQDKQTLQHEVGARDIQLKTLDNQMQLRQKDCASLQQTIQQRDREVSELRQALATKNEEVSMLRMHHIALQAPSSTRSITVDGWQSLPNASASMRHDSSEEASTLQMHHISLQAPSSTRPITVGGWQSLPNASASMWYGSSAVIENKTYFKSHDVNTVYEFSKNRWNKLRSCPNNYCTIVSIDGMLTTVGGVSLPTSNKLYSYIENRWAEQFPPMPIGLRNTAAVYSKNTLIVAGGYSFKPLNSVEILNTVSRRWSSVSSLPVVMDHPSLTIGGDFVYIHPRATTGQEMNSVFKCSFEKLIQSQPSSTIWEKITSLPVNFSSLVTVNDHVLAVGGQETNGDYTLHIHQYVNTSWTVVGHMQYPRSGPLTAVLPDNKLMVVGGGGAPRKCEIAGYTS